MLLRWLVPFVSTAATIVWSQAIPTCPQNYATYFPQGGSYPQICYPSGFSTCPTNYQCLPSQNYAGCYVCCMTMGATPAAGQGISKCIGDTPSVGTCSTYGGPSASMCPKGYGCDSRGVCCPAPWMG